MLDMYILIKTWCIFFNNYNSNLKVYILVSFKEGYLRNDTQRILELFLRIYSLATPSHKKTPKNKFC